MQLAPIDWLVVISYFLVTLGIGLAFRSRAGKNITEYFVSGRSLPWWIAGTSMVATTFAADTPLAVTSMVAKDGLAGNWFWWAFAAGGMLTVFVYARLWRRAEVLTDVELVELRYGGKPAKALRGFRALYVALIVNPIIIGWVTAAMLTVLKQTVLFDETGAGNSSAKDWYVILACMVVVGLYSTIAGMWGVAITDFIQFILAMGGSIALAVVGVRHLGGIEKMHATVVSNFEGGEQAFSYLPNFSIDNPWMPLNIFLIMLFVQWWATWYPGAEPGGGGYIVQRMASCRNERHAVLATLWYQVAHYCVRPWPWLIVAFVALAMYPNLREMSNPGEGFPMVIRDVAPAGLRGLMLVTFFSAYMSTISTQVNWGASYLVRDFYQRFYAPEASDSHLTTVSRITSLLVLAIGSVAAWLMRDVNIDDAWKFLAALGAGTGAVYMLRWFWWRINAWTEIVAMVSSLGYFTVINHFWDLRQEHTMAIVALLTMVTWLIATFATPPEDEATLLRFYRKVRPGGSGWGPQAKLAPEVETDTDLVPSLFAALFAAGIVYLTIPGVGAIIFGEYAKAGKLLSGAGFCVVVVALLLRKLYPHHSR